MRCFNQLVCATLSPGPSYRQAKLLACLLGSLAAGQSQAASFLESTAFTNANSQAFSSSLTGTPSLLGRYGLTAKDIIKTLAPALESCEARLLRVETSGDKSVHETYALYLGKYRLANTRLNLHHHANQLVMLRAELPELNLPNSMFQDDDFLPTESLGFGDGTQQKAERVITTIASGAAGPAWEIMRRDVNTAKTERLLVDAQTGSILSQESIDFDLAQVYMHGPQDGRLSEQELVDLNSSQYLDGRYFSVYAPNENDPRAEADSEGHFKFSPDEANEQNKFDQVQAYFHATRAFTWFRERFAYTPDTRPTIIRTNALIRGQTDNAQFIPAPLGPEVQLGKGSDKMRNLARDSDVLIHELSHGVIYTHLQAHSGESAVLHEGLADYFAYAINNDPKLGESLVPGADYLRTAALPASKTFDSTPQRLSPYVGGEILSAWLWDLRQSESLDASRVDALVYHSLPYLGGKGGLRDMMLGLLSADRDLFPLSPEAAEAKVFGQHKCTILQLAVNRGFGAYLADFDGSSCGLDLVTLAESSRQLSTILDQAPPVRGQPFRILGITTCATIPGLIPGSRVVFDGLRQDLDRLQLTQLSGIFALFLLPLGCALLQSAYAPSPRRKHARKRQPDGGR